MKITISSELIQDEGFTIREFFILLYYLFGGEDILDETTSFKLWNADYLIKTSTGYIFNNNKLSLVEGWSASCNIEETKNLSIQELADKMRELYPNGKKEGTVYYWKDSSKVIAQRLAIFFKKYGDSYSNSQILNATRKYVESFNGDYKYMHLLKYFISKKNINTGEDVSELASYLDNEGQEDNLSEGWLNELR